jgi:hypothetical protein
MFPAMEFAIPRWGNCLTISALMTPTSEPTFAGVFYGKHLVCGGDLDGAGFPGQFDFHPA